MNEHVSLVGVYRAVNAPHVELLVQPALARGWTVAWWALDDVAPALAGVTVGSGAGAKFPLVNEILRRIDSAGDWLVVSDDDAAFDRGDLARLVALSRRAELDLAQPARSDTATDHEITRARRFSLARKTSFVEIGPIFVVGPRWRERIVPFPEVRAMGWGLELEWLDLSREGCALGVVDAVRVRHHGTRGKHYDFDEHVTRVHDELAERGFGHWRDVQTTLATWRPWQRSPSWRSSEVRP